MIIEWHYHHHYFIVLQISPEVNTWPTITIYFRTLVKHFANYGRAWFYHIWNHSRTTKATDLSSRPLTPKAIYSAIQHSAWIMYTYSQALYNEKHSFKRCFRSAWNWPMVPATLGRQFHNFGAAYTKPNAMIFGGYDHCSNVSRWKKHWGVPLVMLEWFSTGAMVGHRSWLWGSGFDSRLGHDREVAG